MSVLLACLLACFVADFWGVRGGEVGVGVERERRIGMEDGWMLLDDVLGRLLTRFVVVGRLSAMEKHRLVRIASIVRRNVCLRLWRRSGIHQKGWSLGYLRHGWRG